ncbi:prefoldin subunit 1 isoform X3 [Bubalus bubalis]|uniref:prefoldin subunit 1 isoform X3 n=1 Tax=Bubalus bubalis TaxID=89462 RepID=UPI001D11C96B|nr:prefoldin subunit 1 isoform X3 [Bubalus bubalis]
MSLECCGRKEASGKWGMVSQSSKAGPGLLRLESRASGSLPAFTELQAKVIDTQQKVKLADVQIEQLNRTKKHAHLTDTEIMTLVDETNMYEGVGRMFILQSKEAIHNQLLEKQKIAEEKIKELEQKKSYLERSVKEAEDNIREMLMARRAQLTVCCVWMVEIQPSSVSLPFSSQLHVQDTTLVASNQPWGYLPFTPQKSELKT